MNRINQRRKLWSRVEGRGCKNRKIPIFPEMIPKSRKKLRFEIWNLNQFSNARLPSNYLYVLWYYDFTIHFLHSKWRKRKFYWKIYLHGAGFSSKSDHRFGFNTLFWVCSLFRYFLTLPHFETFRSPGTEKSKNHTSMKYKKKTRIISQQLSYSLICSTSSLSWIAWINLIAL